MDEVNTSNKAAVNTLTVGHFIIDNYSAFATPILPLLVSKFNTTLAIITAILSIGHLCSSISQPIFGYIADRWRKRFFLFYGLLIASVMNSSIGVAPNLSCLIVCIALGSFGTGFYHPQATSMMVTYADKKNATKEMGIFLACGTLGYSLGPLISSSITNFYGLKFLPLASITGILCAFCILKFVPKTSHLQIVEEKPKFWSSMKVIVKDRTMKILFMIATFKSMATILFGVFPPFIWTQQGFSTFKIGIIVFVFLAVSALGTYSSPYLEAKIGTISTFRLSMMSTLPLICLYALTYKHFPVLSLVFYFMLGYMAMLSVSINMVLAQKHLPQYKSIVAGFIGGFSWGVIGVFLGLFGLIAQNIGVIRLLIIMACIPFGCTYFLKFLPKDEVVK